jgi:hypothetical protein
MGSSDWLGDAKFSVVEEACGWILEDIAEAKGIWRWNVRKKRYIIIGRIIL